MSEPETTVPLRTNWRQVAWITLAALALYFLVRRLPTGTNLSHMDLRVTGKGTLEFCDPANPQFIPVVAVRSPVVMTLRADGAAPASATAGEAPTLARGQEARLTLTLRTASGKPIAPVDLLVAHTKRLHLLVVDPSLADYQHVHPEPGQKPGEWMFALTPRLAGQYRVFADFTPAATARSLYASADFVVPSPPQTPARENNFISSQPPFEFELRPVKRLLQAGDVVDFRLLIRGREGAADFKLEPVMGALAHLVAFDEARSGFAHLHPAPSAPPPSAPGKIPELWFKITFPRPGRYVVWAQTKLDDAERFAPFWLDIAP